MTNDLESGVANREARHASSRLTAIGLLLLVLGVFAVGAAFGSALARSTAVGPHSALVAPDGTVSGGAGNFEQQAQRRRAAPNQTAALDAKALALKTWLEQQVRPAGPAWRRNRPCHVAQRAGLIVLIGHGLIGLQFGLPEF